MTEAEKRTKDNILTEAMRELGSQLLESGSHDQVCGCLFCSVARGRQTAHTSPVSTTMKLFPPPIDDDAHIASTPDTPTPNFQTTGPRWTPEQIPWFEPCYLTMLGGPKVTPEMITAGVAAMLSYDDCDAGDADAREVVGTYLAMKALEPVELVSAGEVAALKERDEAYRYLRGIFEHVAPQCTPLADLMGICTQIDNALAGARIDAEGWRMTVVSRVKELESYTAAMARTYDENSTLGAMNERLRDEIAALTAEKNALHDTVAKFTAANVPVPDPPKHNPFRTFDNDPRRMGP